MTLLVVEINVVRHERLWPRALAGPTFTDADKKAYRKYAETEERLAEEDVEVSFGPATHDLDARDARVEHGRKAVPGNGGSGFSEAVSESHGERPPVRVRHRRRPSGGSS